jgi:hypothetical protein
LGKIVFVADEWLDRARTETHLIAEFISKLATAHSVNNIERFLPDRRLAGQFRRCFDHPTTVLEGSFAIAAKARYIISAIIDIRGKRHG